MAARLVAELAKHVLTLTEQIEHTETLIEDRSTRYELAEVITSMPDIGTLLGAQFLDSSIRQRCSAFSSRTTGASWSAVARQKGDGGSTARG